MDTLECIQTRRSIRKFLDKPVPWELLTAVVDAGRLAPNAGNLQNWKFILVIDENRRKALAEAAVRQLWIATAPAVIVIVAEPEKGKRYYGERGEKLYTTQNCAAAAENMLLAAHNLGLGACWVSAFEEEAVRRALAMPPEVTPQVMIPLGYPDEKPAEPTKTVIEACFYLNKWRSKIANVSAYFYYFGPDIQKAIKGTKKAVEKSTKMAAETAEAIAKKIKAKFEKGKS